MVLGSKRVKKVGLGQYIDFGFPVVRHIAMLQWHLNEAAELHCFYSRSWRRPLPGQKCTFMHLVCTMAQ